MGQSARRRDAAAAQSRRAREPHPRGARDRRQSAHHRLAGAGQRHRHQQAHHQRPAGQSPATSSIASPICRNVWVIADVAEGDLADIKPGTRATVTFRAYPQPAGRGRGHLHLSGHEAGNAHRPRAHRGANPDGRLKTDMYADVVFHAGAERRPGRHRSDSAVIDSGTRQIVLVAKGEGRFEPRAGQARPARRGLCRDRRGPQPGRGGRHLRHFPDRRRKQSAERRSKTFSRAGAAEMIAAAHPLVGAQPPPGRVCRRLPDAGRRLCGVARAARRHSRSLRRAGDRLHGISRPGAAGGRGSGHLSADHGDAERAEIEGGARLLVLRRLLRLRHLRGRHRPLLGALARARISQFGRPPAARRRDAEPRAGRHRRRLGLSIRRARRAEEPRRTAHASRTGTSATASPRRKASPKSPASAASSSNTAWWSIRAGCRRSASRLSKVRDAIRAEQHRCRRPHGRAVRDRIRRARARLYQEPDRSRADRRQDRPRRAGAAERCGARRAGAGRAARHHRTERRGRGRSPASRCSASARTR